MGQRKAAPRSGGEQGPVEPVDMGPNVTEGLQEGRAILEEGVVLRLRRPFAMA